MHLDDVEYGDCVAWIDFPDLPPSRGCTLLYGKLKLGGYDGKNAVHSGHSSISVSEMYDKSVPNSRIMTLDMLPDAVEKPYWIVYYIDSRNLEILEKLGDDPNPPESDEYRIAILWDWGAQSALTEERIKFKPVTRSPRWRI